ncbi:MAG: GIY-YIG nuclease family protein [Armatimonadota bacterium]|nr:GIY-YIG nuclease family protein [Armatimonadota bacterium]
MQEFWVYIMASHSRVLYIGFTNDLSRRVWEHKQGTLPGYASRYNVQYLMYFEKASAAVDGIAREKQLKKWRRDKKVNLIESMNPNWDDLAEDWYR